MDILVKTYNDGYGYLKEIVDAVKTIPVLRWWIADKRGVLLAAFALGAKGVQIGTVLLATKECPTMKTLNNSLLMQQTINHCYRF